jgi:hypothetical protein
MLDYHRLYGWPLENPEQARLLLRDPDLHWKRGRSAFETATAWINARGVPAKVASVLEQAPEWQGAEVAAGFFEHPTALDTQIAPSQTDILVVCGLTSGLGVLAVEGKAGESFGPLVEDWRTSPGRESRYDWACNVFGLDGGVCQNLRWQLFHRTASAVLEAKRFRAAHAVMLVHDFSGAQSSVPDFLAFAERLGLAGAAPDALSAPKIIDGVSLRLGWVCDECAKETP